MKAIKTIKLAPTIQVDVQKAVRGKGRAARQGWRITGWARCGLHLCVLEGFFLAHPTEKRLKAWVAQQIERLEPAGR